MRIIFDSFFVYFFIDQMGVWSIDCTQCNEHLQLMIRSTDEPESKDVGCGFMYSGCGLAETDVVS